MGRGRDEGQVRRGDDDDGDGEDDGGMTLNRQG